MPDNKKRTPSIGISTKREVSLYTPYFWKMLLKNNQYFTCKQISQTVKNPFFLIGRLWLPNRTLFSGLVQLSTCRNMVINHQKMQFFILWILQVIHCFFVRVKTLHCRDCQNISLYIPAISYKCLFFCTFKICLGCANLYISMIFFTDWYKTDFLIFV